MQDGNAARPITPADLENYHQQYSKHAKSATPQASTQAQEPAQNPTAGETSQTEQNPPVGLFNSAPQTDWTSLGGAAASKVNPETGAPQPENQTPELGERLSPQAKNMGKMVARVNDMLASNGLNMIAKNESHKKFKADPDELEELEELWGQYLESTGTDLPPGVILLLAILIIYGSKVPVALSDRKANKTRAEMKVAYKADADKYEEVETEEVGSDDNQNLSRDEIYSRDQEMQNINQLIQAHNVTAEKQIPLFQNHTPKKDMCKWYWLMEGRIMPITKGTFSDGASPQWATLVRMLKAANIPLPKGAISR